MKNLLLFLQLLVLFCFNQLTVELNAQNPAVLSIDHPGPQIFANQTSHVEATIANLSTTPAFGVQAQIQVFDPNNVPIFNLFIPLPPLGPFQTITITTLPNEWYPAIPGPYTIFVNVFGGDDEDPSNNFLAQTTNAVPQPPIEIKQLSLVSPFPIPNSAYGVFEIDLPPVPQPLFVNVMAQDPISGEQAWIVQNLPWMPFPEPQLINYWFDLRQLGFDEGEAVTQLEFSMRIEPNVLTNPFFPPQWQPTVVTSRSYNVISNNPEILTLPPPTTGTLPFFLPAPISSVYRGCTVPNIDLDSGAHPSSPTYAGDHNACGPAAAANSMQWLEDTNPNIPNTGTTHRQKMENMSGHMGRGANQGVTTEQLVQGKLGYIDEYKLPIHVKYQSVFVQAESIDSPNPAYGHKAENKGGTTSATPPTWEFLKSEMEKGEDVEIMFGWYDANGNRHGGHWVTVTGTVEIGPFKGIFIKDDEDQSQPGGTRQIFLPWVTDGPWSRLVGFDGPNRFAWIESVVSESYDPNVTFAAFDFKLERLIWEDPLITPDPALCFFSFSFPPSSETGYLNVTAHFFDPGSLPFDTIWTVRNELLPPRDTIERVSLWWNLADLGWQPGDPLDSVRIHVGVDSNLSVDSFFDVFYTLDLKVDSVEYSVGDGALDNNPVALPIPVFTLPVFDPTQITTFVYRGCEVPNVDLDSLTNNPVTCPGYAGDKNACGPAGAANSMHWLEKKHPNQIPPSGTLREKLKELSGMMNRANNDGVYTDDFIEAKLAFIDKYKLPIHVKFQSFKFGTANIPSPDTLYGHFAENENASANAKPQWDWLVQEMENGEDVELEFGYYDQNGQRQGGHWVTVTGVTEVGGVKRVYFKDDTDQSKAGGMRHQCTEWVNHSSGYSYLKDISGGGYTCWVESVVSESYDPSITFCPDDLTLNQNPIVSGTYSAGTTLYVSGQIPAGENVILSAPNIVFQSGFQIQVGATLTTNSTGCQ